MDNSSDKCRVDFTVDCSADSRRNTNEVDKQALEDIRRAYEEFLKNGRHEEGKVITEKAGNLKERFRQADKAMKGLHRLHLLEMDIEEDRDENLPN